MVAGQPRTATPDKAEAVELGKDLVEWISEETTEVRTIWALWYACKHWMLLEHWKALLQLPEFRPYYEIARAKMAQKLHSQQLEKGMAHRYIGMYERELYDYEDAEKNKDAARTAKAMRKENEELSYRDEYQNKGSMDKK